MRPKPGSIWRAVGASVLGASHRRSGLGNEDASLIPTTAGPPLIVAISDGHGSAQSFRSRIGANMAVESAHEALEAYRLMLKPRREVKRIETEAAAFLPDALVRGWIRRVETHRDQTPICEEHWVRLEEKEGAAARQAVEEMPSIAYGATAVAVLVTETCILCLQLGDGDILTVNRDGVVSNPMPKDPHLIANETTSLCSRKASRYVRVRALPSGPAAPELILLATDGYSNSYRDQDSFSKVAADLWSMVRNHGLASVADQLETWLNDTSETGSGDDITLALVCRMDARL